jgi:hypothetical protein
MNPDNQLRLFVVRSLVPHAIKNESSEQAVLLEYADQTQDDSKVESIELVKSS